MQRSTTGSFIAALAALLLSACGGGGDDPPFQPTPPPPNAAPTANAGPNQTVMSGAAVNLDGSASSDSDGTITTYAWTQTGGTAVTLSGSSSSSPAFTAPTVGATAILTFSLVVTDNRGAPSTASTVTVTVNPVGSGNGTITGRVRFTRIPTSANGLSYGSPQLQNARGVLVRAVNPASPAVPLATGSTDGSGNYTLQVAANINVQVVVVAQMLRDGTQPLPRWDVRVQDAEAAAPTPYIYTSQTVNSNAGAPNNIDIPSGFDSSGAVTGTRASAPFAVLDTIYQGMQLVLGAAPGTNFPALIVDWAADNPGGETFFTNGPTQMIVLSADTTEDTDEFDQHVVAHEFGHYIEFNFSRADNIGGAHGPGDKLDIRVAFGEGFGYAFGAIVLNDPVTRDTFTSNMQFGGCSAQINGHYYCTSQFNVDTNPQTSPAGAPNNDYGCWCSESSVWAVLWDIYDSGAEINDSVALGFQPIWNVLTGAQRTTRAFTSIFSFVDALKDNNAANPTIVAAIDTLLTAQNITPVTDIYGTNETHFPNPPVTPGNHALPLYTDVTLGVMATAVSADDAGLYNTLGNHRYFKFTLATTQMITISVTTSNGDVNADPDFTVWRNGARVNVNGEKPPPQPETVTFSAQAGDYLIDAYDCANGCDTVQGTRGDYNINVTVN